MSRCHPGLPQTARRGAGGRAGPGSKDQQSPNPVKVRPLGDPFHFSGEVRLTSEKKMSTPQRLVLCCMPKEWRMTIICVSPDARSRARFVISSLRDAYSAHPHVPLRHVSVKFDGRVAGRAAYAPNFAFDAKGKGARTVTEDVTWQGRFDSLFVVGAICADQGASFRSLIEQGVPMFACNGFPGFNVGSGAEADALTSFVKAQPRGIVEDARSALVASLDQHERYMAALPHRARAEALKSRVVFPLTAKGDTSDGAGSCARRPASLPRLSRQGRGEGHVGEGMGGAEIRSLPPLQTGDSTATTASGRPSATSNGMSDCWTRMRSVLTATARLPGFSCVARGRSSSRATCQAPRAPPLRPFSTCWRRT